VFIVAVALAGVGAILAVLAAWDLPPFRARTVATDDAYVYGRTTVIAPEVSGYVVEVAVKDYDYVKAGQVLVRVDSRTYRARMEQARWNLANAEASLANNRQARASRLAQVEIQVSGVASAQAQLSKARADMARASDLVRDGSISVRERDQTLATLRQAEAQVSQAEAAEDSAGQDVRTVDVGRSGLEAQVNAARAELAAAQVDLDNTVIRATESGQLGEVGVHLGQYVTNGTELMAVVPPDRWVIADYKEAQTVHITPGQPASFTVDALGGAQFTGRVTRLAPAAESEFAVLKPENATGNFVKVPQRIGVMISLDPAEPLVARLKPGMSVEARIDTERSQ
jgi:multidrug resistance efflux pump